MAWHIKITSLWTGDVVVLEIFGANSLRVTTDQEIAGRFGLKIGGFEIFEESGDCGICAQSKHFRDEKRWYLKGGALYDLLQNGVGQSTSTSAGPSQLRPTSPRPS
ncbi:unnamed protein product [Calypogeia fissa]